ncbi:hypothetical protein F66182_2567 [Fusarium sp. NRRL 66182]|nr:hypothetical protein F66182_2567 [Fusarium sp. NRRL 66182]
MAEDLNSTLAVPMKLDAFVFNEQVCSGGDDGDEARAKIAPITQPNYTFLRLHDSLIQSDILPHVDIHNSFQNKYNSRLTNIDTGEVYKHRQGVYLHWMLPRVYRSGIAATEEGGLDRDKEGLPDAADPDTSAPEFRPIPNRWLVIRRLRESVPDFRSIRVPEYQAWVIESDEQTKVTDMPDGVDLQVDVSPFISAPEGEDVDIGEQAEIFIGSKTPIHDWKESDPRRAPMTVLNGGNILFPDFQQHNSNVLSMLDNFTYGSGEAQSTIESATVDYYVVGWHAEADRDPFYIREKSKATRSQRLKNCHMFLKPESKDGQDWSTESISGQTISHGAMYNVKWNAKEKPQNIPADKVSHQLHDAAPVAIGTTPLDALLAYVKAHKADESDQDIKNVMIAIENIQKYLLVEEDTVDSHAKAQDLLHNFNFDNFPGGTRFHIASATDSGKPTVRPDDAIIGKLGRLNQEQVRLDSLDRTEQRLQWNLFSVWWSFVSQGLPEGDEEKGKLTQDIKKRVTALMKEKQAIDTARKESKGQRGDVLNDPTIQRLIENDMIAKSVYSNFHTQQDPNLLVGHIESAWPHDWLESLFVRVNTDITAWESRDKLGQTRQAVGIEKLPGDIQDTVTALVKEFIDLGNASKDDNASSAKPLAPLYHDTDPRWGRPRDDWGNTQPFFPLFMEWEAEYAHIDYEEWSLEARKFESDGSDKFSFGISDKTPLWDKPEWKTDITPKWKQNIRTLSGRVLVLPQASFSLQAQVKQVIDQTPPEELKKALGDMDPDHLVRDLSKLTFLSSPMAGFHDHLLTMSQGTHIKPTIRQPGGKLYYMKDATDDDAGLLKMHLEYMGTETDLTPYASLVYVSTETDDSPFKPVTHGQFKITKLNIVDKFGQVIHALDPRWEAPPQNLRPCLSEYFAPQQLHDKTPNIVQKPFPGQIGTHYAQIPPHMNQMARVNSCFVERNKNGTWSPQNEWDKPIWGWIVYNYIDRAIQFFLPEGRFYREVRMGGETGATKSEKWLPFKDTSGLAEGKTQLDRLIDAFASDEEYLSAMLGMIGGAMDYAAAAPDAYAQFLNSIIGRPLALVNMAWSLELGTDEFTSQSSVRTANPARHLLPATESGAPKRHLYEFPLKLGDKSRAYDGLVGYFKTLPREEQSQDSYLDLETCYTYFGAKAKGEFTLPLDSIKPDNFPRLKPFYVDAVGSTSEQMETKRNKMLEENTFGAIVDPFHAVHGYTSILPTQPLKIPEWAWQEALSRMTAFFHFGPLTVTKDVPDFNKDYLLTAETDIKDPKSIIVDAVGLPKMGMADWAWLQPYSEKLQESGREETCFMPLGLAGAENEPKFREGPYTSVEGYLLLRKSIVRE